MSEVLVVDMTKEKVGKRREWDNTPRKIVSTVNAMRLVEILEEIAENPEEQTKNRISAASKLLDKVVPDLKSTESLVLNADMELGLEDKTFLIQQLIRKRRGEGVIDVSPLPRKEELPLEKKSILDGII